MRGGWPAGVALLESVFESGERVLVFSQYVETLEALTGIVRAEPGVGLNLTAATRVAHYDLWFNPSVENQATDRAFRIGQKSGVFVHRLTARDAIEERPDAMIASRRELSELTIRSDEPWLADQGDGELRTLAALR